MSKTEETTQTLPQAIRKSAIGLAIFAFFTAGIISITQYLTKETIAQNVAAFEARSLLSLLPERYDQDDVVAGAAAFEDTDLTGVGRLNIKPENNRFYRFYDAQGNVSSVILPVIAPEGYTEAIRLIVGIRANGRILGVRVTRHKETPGLGDQVELAKSDWVLGFNERSLQNTALEAWAVKKDGGSFDQLTGATITPRAIVNAVKNSLLFFNDNREVLLTSPTVSEATS